MFKQKDMDFLTEFQNAFVKNKDSTNQLQQLQIQEQDLNRQIKEF